jgi:hypothetical protein
VNPYYSQKRALLLLETALKESLTIPRNEPHYSQKQPLKKALLLPGRADALVEIWTKQSLGLAFYPCDIASPALAWGTRYLPCTTIRGRNKTGVDQCNRTYKAAEIAGFAIKIGNVCRTILVLIHAMHSIRLRVVIRTFVA